MQHIACSWHERLAAKRVRARTPVRTRAQARAHVRERVRAGFTLAETLAAMAILLLASSIVAAGVPAAQRAYVAAVDTSNAQVLLSTTATRLRAEVSVADPATIEYASKLSESDQAAGYLLRYDSLETGCATAIRYDSSEDDDGNLWGLVVEQTTANGTTVETRLVPRKAAAGANADLTVTVGSATYDKDAGIATLSDLKVVRADGAQLERAGLDTLSIKVISATAADADTGA